MQLNLNHIPGAIGYKNSESRYTVANDCLAHFMGYQKASEVIGLSDYDVQTSMVELAPEFIAQDQQVLAQGEAQHLDIGFYSNNDLQIHFSSKKTIFDEMGTAIGTVYHCIELKSTFIK